ncbi:transmembrane channel-like protein [Carpediemonas membranifera]|uniref:Transmembrane channel-like protein n=1 Tax=Carpediemonas membranifera TaxID=201153 RepID=A0A8J6B6T7_9EUKA|nr:transmembrane channel-like protein [Carpediemonas membranifera]|eukprot:KAG9395479.1 transmembrane channel-like protein [Carpediemonas membranifera]
MPRQIQLASGFVVDAEDDELTPTIEQFQPQQPAESEEATPASSSPMYMLGANRRRRRKTNRSRGSALNSDGLNLEATPSPIAASPDQTPDSTIPPQIHSERHHHGPARPSDSLEPVSPVGRMHNHAREVSAVDCDVPNHAHGADGVRPTPPYNRRVDVHSATPPGSAQGSRADILDSAQIIADSDSDGVEEIDVGLDPKQTRKAVLIAPGSNRDVLPAVHGDDPAPQPDRREFYNDWAKSMKMTVRSSYNPHMKKHPAPAPEGEENTAWTRIKARALALYTWYKYQLRKRHGPVQLWRKQILNIEGHFGSGVASFFIFQRNVFILDAAIMLLWLIPLALGLLSDVWRDYFEAKDLRWWIVDSWFGMTPLFYSGYPSTLNGDDFKWLTGILPAGPVKDAVLWTLARLPTVPVDLLWATCVVLTYIVSFAVLVYWIKQHFFTASEDDLLVSNNEYPMGTLVYGSWDMGIASRHAGRLLKANIITRLRELAEKERIQAQALHRSLPSALLDYAAKVAGFLVSVALMTVSGTIVVTMVQISKMYGDQYAFITLITTACIGINNFGIPLCIRFVSVFERWRNPNHAILFTVARIWFVKMFAIFIVVYQNFGDIAYRTVFARFSDIVPVNSTDTCPMSNIGIQFWYLLWMDLAITAAADIGLAVLPWVVTRQRSEFVITVNTIDTMYRQALFWIAAILSPANAIVGVISHGSMFFILYYVTVWTNAPQKTSWGASRISHYFLVLLSLTMIVTMVPMLIVLLLVGGIEGEECGPFIAHGSGYKTVLHYMEQLSIAGTSLKDAFEYLLRPAVLAPFVVICLVGIYFLWALRRRSTRKAHTIGTLIDTTKRDTAKLVLTIHKQAKKDAILKTDELTIQEKRDILMKMVSRQRNQKKTLQMQKYQFEQLKAKKQALLAEAEAEREARRVADEELRKLKAKAEREMSKIKRIEEKTEQTSAAVKAEAAKMSAILQQPSPMMAGSPQMAVDSRRQSVVSSTAGQAGSQVGGRGIPAPQPVMGNAEPAWAGAMHPSMRSAAPSNAGSAQTAPAPAHEQEKKQEKKSRRRRSSAAEGAPSGFDPQQAWAQQQQMYVAQQQGRAQSHVGVPAPHMAMMGQQMNPMMRGPASAAPGWGRRR